MVIFPFLVNLTLKDPPLARCTKLLGAWGPHLRVPAPPPGPTPSPNFRHHILFSLGGRFGTPQQMVDSKIVVLSQWSLLYQKSKKTHFFCQNFRFVFHKSSSVAMTKREGERAKEEGRSLKPIMGRRLGGERAGKIPSKGLLLPLTNYNNTNDNNKTGKESHLMNSCVVWFSVRVNFRHSEMKPL